MKHTSTFTLTFTGSSLTLISSSARLLQEKSIPSESPPLSSYFDRESRDDFSRRDDSFFTSGSFLEGDFESLVEGEVLESLVREDVDLSLVRVDSLSLLDSFSLSLLDLLLDDSRSLSFVLVLLSFSDRCSLVSLLLFLS